MNHMEFIQQMYALCGTVQYKSAYGGTSWLTFRDVNASDVKKLLVAYLKDAIVDGRKIRGAGEWNAVIRQGRTKHFFVDGAHFGITQLANDTWLWSHDILDAKTKFAFSGWTDIYLNYDEDEKVS